MLEAMWSARRNDLLDLITPFIMFAVSKQTSPSEAINIQAVQKYVQENFAYTDIPESIITKVLRRNPYKAICKRNGQFILQQPIDEQIERIEKRRETCDQYLCSLGNELAEYLKDHCKRSNKFSSDSAINHLHRFFSRYGLEAGMERLSSVEISPQNNEIDYYIARFIFDCKDTNSSMYSHIIELIKGYFLRLAIYIQPDNGGDQKSSYENVCFYYDTPFLIDLLGYSGSQRAQNAISLHDMLRRQNCRFYYFPHVEQELQSVLHAYKYSLMSNNSNSTRTLEGLNQKDFSPSDVERETVMLGHKLAALGLKEKRLPPYDIKQDGSVDERKVIDEVGLKQYIKANTPHYSDENLDNDVSAGLAIHRLRNGNISHSMETCGHIMVTTNFDFTQAFNNYYKESISRDSFPLIISISDLSALVWVKCGEVGDLPETELLKNAFCAMQPTPEVLTKVDDILIKLQLDGQFSQEQVMALRTSRFLQADIWKQSYGDLNQVTETTIKEAAKKYDEQLLEKTKNEFDEKLASIKDLSHQEQLRFEEEKNRQAEKARKKADEIAKEKRKEWIKPRIALLRISSIVVIVFAIVGTILSAFNSAWGWGTAFITATVLLSVVSVIDTAKQDGILLMKWLNKRANCYETSVREQKLQEYKSVLLEAETTSEENDMAQPVLI